MSSWTYIDYSCIVIKGLTKTQASESLIGRSNLGATPTIVQLAA